MTDNRLVESWTWYAVASLIFVLRYVSRVVRLGGWKYFELEDLAMLITFGFYTNVIVWVNIQNQHPNTNILPPTGTAGMTQADIDDRIYGSKVTFVIEESMLMVQWGCKFCICLLYYKLTMGLPEERWVKFLIAYVVFGWLVVEVFFFGIWCRPFLDYFRVFDSNSLQCTTSGHHLIMSYVFNCSSDVLMLCVPIPLLVKSKMPWKQKAVITAIFSLGGFVIIAATLNRYYCFAHPDSILWIYWYVREASTAVIVANIPHAYALFRTIFNIQDVPSFLSGRRRAKYASASGEMPHDLQGIRIKDSNASDHTATLEIWQQYEYRVQDSTPGRRWDEETAVGTDLGTKSTVVSTEEERTDEQRMLGQAL